MVDQVTRARTPAGGDAPSRGPRGGGRPIGPLGLFARGALPAALLLWALALPRVRIDRMGDLGLLQVLPVLYWAGLALLVTGFVAVLHDPRIRQRWAAGYVLALIAFIHATPTLLYPTLRYAWAWKHVMVVDAMLRHDGSVPHAGELDIYNQWPGFFQLNVLLLRATGLHSSLGYAAWYPVLANVLLLGPLLLVFRSVTQDRRLVWGGIWIYFSASWVGQDYFSPQAFTYLLFLAVLALVLRRLAAARAAQPPDGAPPGEGTGARAVTWVSDTPARAGWRPLPFALLLVLIAAIVCSHQLTPLMLISTLLMLALRRRNRRVVLPALAAAVAITFAWDATVARPYLARNIDNLVAALASPDSNALPGLQRLAQPAAAQVFASWVDRGLTAAVLLLAVAAVVRHRWVRRTNLPLLLCAPVPLLLANNYGGEMVFRAYLFALPAAALLAATLVIPSGARAPVRPRGVRRALPVLHWGLTTAVLFSLLGGLLFGYYSKESMNSFTPGEVAALRYVAHTAPPGSRIISITADLPGGEERYDEHSRAALALGTPEDRRHLLTDPGAAVEAALADPAITGPSYLVLTRAQIAECELTGILPADTVDRVRAAASASSTLRVVFTDGDAVVYRHTAPVAPESLFSESGTP
ncbi:glycosyltransferase [Kitasatospora sp. NPDC052868]|uniref:glycosyltransferase n=1 Tax=Kitasatospora sp. NPDC052868 TaxID=3364060 RepID=UPI0037C660B1